MLELIILIFGLTVIIGAAEQGFRFFVNLGAKEEKQEADKRIARIKDSLKCLK